MFANQIFRSSLLALFLAAFPLNSALSQDRILEIAINQSSPPFSYLDDGGMKGIFVDLVRETVERRMGIKVEFYAYTWEGAQRMVKLGQRDGMVTNATPARLEYAKASSEQIYFAPILPLVKKGSDAGKKLSANPEIMTLKKLKFCHGKASGWHTWFTKKNGIDSFPVTDAKACIRMINTGRMDVMVYSTDMMLWDVRSLRLQDKFEVLPIDFGAWKFKLLISKESDFGEDFLSKFDQVISEMKSNGDYEKFTQSMVIKYR